jgi:hypothetical protein
MYYLFVKHKVADFARWKGVFDADADAQRKAGLHLLHVLRDTADPNLVVLLFKTDDLTKAKAFTSSPKADVSKENAGVLGMPEILFLTDFQIKVL